MKSLLALLVFTPIIALAKPFVIGAIGDLNGTECQALYPSNSITAMNRLTQHQDLNHIIMPGDAVHGECIKYSKPQPYEDVARSMWKEFDLQFVQKALRLGIFPILAPGNHDAPYISPGSSPRKTFQIENAEFRKYWLDNRSRLNVAPLEIEGTHHNYPYYWAYKVDSILFIVLQSTRTHTLSNPIEQKKWLQALLKSPEAKSARYRISFGHVPVYAVLDPSVGKKYDAILDKEQIGKANGLMDILLNGNVNLMVVGHSHAAYPAELQRKSDGKKMVIASMPCAHSPRTLYSKSESSKRGFALIKISDSNQLTLTFHDWKTGETIPHTYFPASIPTKDPNSTYLRVAESVYR